MWIFYFLEWYHRIVTLNMGERVRCRTELRAKYGSKSVGCIRNSIVGRHLRQKTKWDVSLQNTGLFETLWICVRRGSSSKGAGHRSQIQALQP